MRDIKITRVMNGFVVTVGCQKLVFESEAGLLQNLHLYLSDPQKTEEQFIKRFGLQGGTPVDPCDQVVPMPPGYANGVSTTVGYDGPVTASVGQFYSGTDYSARGR